MKSTIAVFSLVSLCYILNGVHPATFTFKNNCPYKIWPSGLTGRGNPLPSTGFDLPSKATKSLNVPAPWSGRFWARTSCSIDASGKFKCETGDCTSGQVACNGAGGIPPASLVEFTLQGDGNRDFYDVSLVDGFNLPLSITSDKGCKSPTCKADIDKSCPPELALKGSNGNVIACKSACLAFNAPEYCCTGSHSTPQTCPPTKYSQIFKTRCPQAYSYAYDDKTSTFTCPTGGNYSIKFCP